MRDPTSDLLRLLTLRRVQQSERLGLILERLSMNGSVSVADIAADLSVSPATIRRFRMTGIPAARILA